MENLGLDFRVVVVERAAQGESFQASEKLVDGLVTMLYCFVKQDGVELSVGGRAESFCDDPDRVGVGLIPLGLAVC